MLHTCIHMCQHLCTIEPSHQRAAATAGPAHKGKPVAGAKPTIQSKPAGIAVNKAQTSKGSTTKAGVSLVYWRPRTCMLQRAHDFMAFDFLPAINAWPDN